MLDTHVWLWSLLDPDRLSEPARGALENPGNELWLSPVSVWEALILAERGRLDLGEAVSTWIQSAFAAMPLRDAPLTREVAIASRAIEAPTHDPADRFLAGSALVHGLTLTTADRRLLDGSGYETLAAA